MTEEDKKYMKEAIKEAKISLNQGGIPIGAVLVEKDIIVGRGHNKLLQNGSTILHAEMDCIENAGRLTGADYKKCTLYTTLSPCEMCSGTILLYNIPRVVMGENVTLTGPEEYLTKNGVLLVNLDLQECKDLIGNYINKNLNLWDQEIERVHK